MAVGPLLVAGAVVGSEAVGKGTGVPVDASWVLGTWVGVGLGFWGVFTGTGVVEGVTITYTFTTCVLTTTEGSAREGEGTGAGTTEVGRADGTG